MDYLIVLRPIFDTTENVFRYVPDNDIEGDILGWTTSGGEFNKGRRRKRLDIGGDRMEKKHQMGGRVHFYDNIEC